MSWSEMKYASLHYFLGIEFADRVEIGMLEQQTLYEHTDIENISNKTSG